jgi:hypothetical protein
LSSSTEKHSVLNTYEQQQTPPQQRSSLEDSYQQQSYKSEVVVLILFAFDFTSLFFMINTFALKVTTKRENSSLKKRISARATFYDLAPIF